MWRPVGHDRIELASLLAVLLSRDLPVNLGPPTHRLVARNGKSAQFDKLISSFTAYLKNPTIIALNNIHSAGLLNRKTRSSKQHQSVDTSRTSPWAAGTCAHP